MSNSVTDENEELILLDVLGFPSNQILFNPISKNIIYSLGSNLISYNLISNSKTFVQYLSNKIILLKFLDESQNYLLTIDDSPSPLLCIWELPSFTQIYSTEIIIPSQNGYSMSNIYLEKLYEEIYLILITSNIGINYLYILKNENEINSNYNLELFGKLSNIKEIVYGFKVFYNSKDAVFLLEKNLLYYNLDLDKENCNEKMKIDFPFGIQNNSLIINRDINIIAFLTAKGNCLIYDQNGNNKPSINPFDQEYFTSCEFEGDSICLGTNNGKIYVYNIYDNKPKFFIHYKAILRIKNNFQLNKKNDITKRNIYNDNEIDENSVGPCVKYIYLNEKINQTFLRFEDNSILFSPLNILVDDLYYQNNESSNNNSNSFIFYAFNHSKNIDDIIINNIQNLNSSNDLNDFDSNKNNINNNDIELFSCSKDQKIIKYYIDYETNKLSNSFFNLKPILSNNQSQGRIITNSNNNKSINNNINCNIVYLTILKYHPIYNNKLFAGDNKGFLYLFDTKENKFQYKKPIYGTYEIVFLEFSPDGQFLCIGFDTGCQIICNMKKDCEICLELNNHYMPVEESEFRKINNQIICFSYFFKNRNRHCDCFLYTKNNYLLEYSKLLYGRYKLNKKEIKTIKIINQILDIKIHTSENYAIILNNTNQIMITYIISGIITAVIDLNSRVKSANNIQIDNSGLFLGVICELFNNRENKSIYSYVNYNSKAGRINKNCVIIFEIGTGKIKTFINYINSISRILFDNEGNYLIMAGEKGELSLWKLTESMSNNIKYVLEEMKTNKNFWDEYEIKYDNNLDFKDEIVNNSDYVINNRTNKNILNENNQVKHDIQFNSRKYKREDIKNSMNSNNNYNNSNSNISSNYIRRNKNKNESQRNSEYEKKYYYTDSLANIKNNRNEYDNDKYRNMTSIEDKSNEYNNFKKYDSISVKRAPLLINSKELLKEKEKYNEEKNIDIKNVNDNNEKDNIDYKYEMNYSKEKNFNNIKFDSYKNDRLPKQKNIIRNNENSLKENIDYYDLKQKELIKNENDKNKYNNIKNNQNKNINNIDSFQKDNNINNSLKNSINKYNNTNGMEYKYQFKNENQTTNRNISSIAYKTMNNNNIINTSKTYSNKNFNKSMKYLNLNTFSQRAPKLNHINLVNASIPTNNKIYKTIINDSNRNNNNILHSTENTIFTSIDKNEEIRKKNIKNAINQLLDNNSLKKYNLEKDKNIQLTINTQKEPKINLENNNFQEFNSIENNICNYNEQNNKMSNIQNIIKNKNKSNNNISEDFIIINNKKIKLYDNDSGESGNLNNNNLISLEIRNKFGMSKKYPEPDDIDDNLINSLVEPIPDLEQHSKIQKIEIDDFNQFEQSNTKSNLKRNNSIKNNNILNSKMNDENKLKNLNNKKITSINNKKDKGDNDNLFKSSDEEEYNGNDIFE